MERYVFDENVETKLMSVEGGFEVKERSDLMVRIQKFNFDSFYIGLLYTC